MQKNLQEAKNAKNDEFYTQYNVIQREINAYLEFDQDAFRGKTILLPCDDPDWSNFTRFFAQNFEYFGLKKLISTSYAVNSKRYKEVMQLSLFETNSPKYDPSKTDTNGKIFILDRAANGSHRLDIHDLKWDYLQGDGDFRSPEVKALRDDADIIVTNPPFSLFREFLSWIIEADKKFLIIGNKNAITYKEVFPLIKDNKIWAGARPMGADMYFQAPQGYIEEILDKERMTAVALVGDEYLARSPSMWFTNLDHGRRHEPLILMNMADNMKFNKTIVKQGKKYFKYDNYDAIDVPVTQAIPSDYDGVMGVPVSFLDKYCPEQFEIIGMGTGDNAKEIGITKNYRGRTDLSLTLPDGTHTCPFQRILIRWKQPPEQRQVQ